MRMYFKTGAPTLASLVRNEAKPKFLVIQGRLINYYLP
jgi:hypothetical protein